MTAPTEQPVVPPGRSGDRSALGSAAILLLGAALVGAATLIGVAHTYDGSPLGIATGAVWVVLLPAIAAVALAASKPTLGLAFTAGAGAVSLARVIADLGLLTGPNAVIRPELFYETSARALPFTLAAGGIALLVGDLMMLAAGLWAARRLTGAPSFGPEPIFDADPTEPAAAGSPVGPNLLAEAFDSADLDQAAPAGADVPDETPPGPTRNNLLISVGFVGVLALLTASLTLPYTGGYLADRYLPPELGLWGIGAALALAVVATIAVLAAAILPRWIAFALLSGVAAAAAVPFLTALAVRAVGAPVQLNPVVALGLAGAVLVAAAGLLARDGPLKATPGDSPVVSLRRLDITGAVLSLLVAAAAAAAWRLPQLRYNGGADPKLTDGFAISAPLSLPFAVAMVVPLIGGVLWLVPSSVRAGRAVASIGWISVVYAATQSLYVLGQVVASAAVPNAGFAAPNWSAGPGLWSAIAGIGLGIGTLAFSIAASRSAAQESLSVPDDDLLAESRTFGTLVASVLTGLTVVALALPVYRTSAGSAATLLVGFQVSSWGVLALAAGMVGAAWSGGRAINVSQAVAFPLTGAAILGVRLVIPRAVSAQEGFEKAAGLYAGYLVAAAFLVAAVALARSSKRITMTDVSNLPGWRPGGARVRAGQGGKSVTTKTARPRPNKGSG